MEYRLAVVICQFLFLFSDLVILYNFRRNRPDNKSQAIFFKFTICVIMMQFFSLSTQLIPELWCPPVIVHYIAMSLYLISITICFFCMHLYLKQMIMDDIIPNIIGHIISMLPIMVITISCIMAPIRHGLFYIDADCIYHRGNLFFLQIVCPYSYGVMTLFLSYRFRKESNRLRMKKMLRYFALFLAPSIVCALIQLLLIMGAYTSVGISIGLILIYLEVYVEEINNARHIKNMEELNKQLLQTNNRLQEVNEEQEEHIEQIAELNTQLNDNRLRLEKAAEEQRYRIEEITGLNKRLDEDRLELSRQLAVIEVTASRYFCVYTIKISNNYFREVSTTPEMRSVLGTEGDAAYVLNLVCDKMVLPEDREKMRSFNDISQWRVRLRDRDSCSCEYRGVNTGWSRVTTFVAARDENGQADGIVLVCEKIHEQKEYEERLESANREAEEASTAKTSFLFNMSHDIRTPMNAIIGFRDLLEKHQEDPKKRGDYLRKIRDASNVLLSIINNVLEMARIEKGTVEIDEFPRSLVQFGSSLYEFFQEMMMQKGISFSYQVLLKDPYVFCDPIKLREVFNNILSNAYKYTEPGGSVLLKLEQLKCDREGYAIYRTTISDTGVGISEEFMPHLFEEFSREHSTTEARIEGTGLGMPIVKRLTELMGGTIEVSSTKGEGTTFVVTFPLRIADKSMLLEHDAVFVDPKLFLGKRILLAEDNELNAEIAEELLKEAGFIVDFAADGVICLNKLKASEPGYYDLILMDIQMPNMNGYETTKAIRALDDELKAGTKIIAMTANAFEEDKREALRAGMDGHLAKPVNMRELTEMLAEILG